MNSNYSRLSPSISLFKRYRDPLLVLLLLLLPFVFYVSHSKSKQEYTVFDKLVLTASAPVQWLVVGAIDGIAHVWHSYVHLTHVQMHNDALRAENAHLHAELAARLEEHYENERLRMLVGLREAAPQVEMLFARVIGMSPTPLFRSVRIDKGAKDGVSLGSAVISEYGVVGRVAGLSHAYADVMLLVDSSSSIDVLVQRTRARARVRGQGSDDAFDVEVQYLARIADVEPGDILVTSGLGTTFPKGLPVGKVMSVERQAFGLYQRAVVQPSVEFSQLEGVLVIAPNYPVDTAVAWPMHDSAKL